MADTRHAERVMLGGVGVLEYVGLTRAEEQVYRLLLQRPETTRDAIASELHLSAGHIRRVLATLESKGLVFTTPGRPVRYSPAQPDLAVEALILQRQQELGQARAEANLLVEEFLRGARARGTGRLVDLVEGAEAVRQRFRQMEAGVTEELFLVDKPPYVLPPTGVNEAELDLLARGVRCRVLYDSSSFDVPGKLAWAEECIAAGEEARVLSGLPAKIDIADRRLAMVFETNAEALGSAVVVHPSALLDSLVMITETLWARALPLPSGSAAEAEIDYPLLALMAAGVKDAAVARQLGVSLRTVHRRVASLTDQLGAETRFQAGVQAARLGWLTEE